MKRRWLVNKYWGNILWNRRREGQVSLQRNDPVKQVVLYIAQVFVFVYLSKWRRKRQSVEMSFKHIKRVEYLPRSLLLKVRFGVCYPLIRRLKFCLIDQCTEWKTV